MGLIWLMVALGGGLGCVCRYGVNRLALAYAGPNTVVGTFAVNVTGSFALGFSAALALERLDVSPALRALVATGFLGGYTTFSTLSVESVHLLQTGEPLRAAASLVGNVVLGLLAAYLGILAARLV